MDSACEHCLELLLDPLADEEGHLAMEAHLAGCPTCRAAADLLPRMARRWGGEPPVAEFAAASTRLRRAVEALSAPPPHAPPLRRWWGWSHLISSTAVLALALTVFLVTRPPAAGTANDARNGAAWLPPPSSRVELERNRRFFRALDADFDGRLEWIAVAGDRYEIGTYPATDDGADLWMVEALLARDAGAGPAEAMGRVHWSLVKGSSAVIAAELPDGGDVTYSLTLRDGGERLAEVACVRRNGRRERVAALTTRVAIPEDGWTAAGEWREGTARWRLYVTGRRLPAAEAEPPAPAITVGA